MLFRAPRHFYQMNRDTWQQHLMCVNALPSSTSFLLRIKNGQKGIRLLVSMLFRAPRHFSCKSKNRKIKKGGVSMLFRAPRHFYPTLSETLDLQGFLRPFLQVFIRIFWQIVFFGGFLCLSDFFHIFQAVLGFFQFLLQPWFSPFFLLALLFFLLLLL